MAKTPTNELRDFPNRCVAGVLPYLVAHTQHTATAWCFCGRPTKAKGLLMKIRMRRKNY
ncbi:MAG: hypothetical protein KBF82_12450 [Chitinophagaceae bacterium]|nr:hypothetical protein [Chitinophagaceae bacterium]